jgi:hypothetical protein
MRWTVAAARGEEQPEDERPGHELDLVVGTLFLSYGSVFLAHLQSAEERAWYGAVVGAPNRRAKGLLPAGAAPSFDSILASLLKATLATFGATPEGIFSRLDGLREGTGRGSCRFDYAAFSPVAGHLEITLGSEMDRSYWTLWQGALHSMLELCGRRGSVALPSDAPHSRMGAFHMEWSAVARPSQAAFRSSSD